MKLSIIIPARNEADALMELLPDIARRCGDAEVIVVDDGSTDNTKEVCRDCGVRVISHPYSKGNGAAIKSGARAASGDIVVCMDADGQHQPQDIQRLVHKLEEGYEMVVGARSRDSQATLGRSLANRLYNRLATWMVGHAVKDLTSGFRALWARNFREFVFLLPNGFSYPTTLTMAFFRAGYSVAYVPIRALSRNGQSHIRPLRDGLRFLVIIFKVATLYSPLKIFIPVSAGLFLTGLAYYGYTYATMGRFTNMSALLFIVSIILFLIGLVSEQITSLLYGRQTADSG